MELAMLFETILLEKVAHSLMLTIHRPEQRNSINDQLIKEMHQVLDYAEHDPTCRFIILQGENGFFCTGMDFKELPLQALTVKSDNIDYFAEYMRLLNRFTTTSKIIISLVDGQVLAGGMGLIAASDMVISKMCSQFGLSEVLWGLLPACVVPFLIRRIGFQKTYRLTLNSLNINANEAHLCGLVDELTQNDLHDSLRRLILRLERIEEETVGELKDYFGKMWIINEAMQATAVAEISRLIAKPLVQNNIKNFIERQQFPWEKQTNINV